jgi:hypothetical protein
MSSRPTRHQSSVSAFRTLDRVKGYSRNFPHPYNEERFYLYAVRYKFIHILYKTGCYLERITSLFSRVFFFPFSMALDLFFSFLILYTVGRTPWKWGISPSQGVYLQMTTQTQNKLTQTSMPRVGFEPKIPVFERAKAIHALDPATTVIGLLSRRSWLRHYATSWKVAGSSSDEMDFFQLT